MSVRPRTGATPGADASAAKPDRPAPAAGAERGSAQPPARVGDIDGAAFALDEASSISAVWGAGPAVAWPEGEPTLIYGPDGVGKTTVCQQLMLHHAGIRAPELFGLPVKASGGKVLYLALDRPKQAARSLRRMVSETDRDALKSRIAVWRGALPFEVTTNPQALAKFAIDRNAGTIIVDSLKDLAPKLSDEDTGTALHRAFQACVQHGVEVLVLHHPRKAQADNKRPRALADVYGSRWITAGMGSVLLLWGDAGDPIVELEHLKQPADVVGPFLLLHDNRAGTTTVIETGDVAELVAAQPGATATVAEIAAALFRTEPDRTQIEKARRRLEAAVENGRLHRLPVEAGQATRYRVAEGGHAEGHGGSREGVTPKGHGGPYVVGVRDPGSRLGSGYVPQCSCADDPDRLSDGRFSRCFGVAS
ncbi:MAG: AAA family ATPase [Solirubrobacteraceae bacterium]